MAPRFNLVIAALFAGTALIAQQAENGADTPSELTVYDSLLRPDTSNLSDFLWLARPIVVFADSPNDPRFGTQVALLKELAGELAERDVIVLLDTDPAANGPLRQKLRPRGFMLALIGKDGDVKLRKASPWDVRELSRTIDKMPMRQREVRERREP